MFNNLLKCLLISMCFVFAACTKDMQVQSFDGRGKLSGSVLYHSDYNGEITNLPLLVQAEWRGSSNASANNSSGDIALLMMNGSLLARCEYSATELVCKPRLSLPYAEDVAELSARLVSASINHLQGKTAVIPRTMHFEVIDERGEDIYLLRQRNESVKLKIKELVWE